jgi:hypothetical protein
MTGERKLLIAVFFAVASAICVVAITILQGC